MIGMNAPSEVRDEIYFQIIKQQHKNPNKYFFFKILIKINKKYLNIQKYSKINKIKL